MNKNDSYFKSLLDPRDREDNIKGINVPGIFFEEVVPPEDLYPAQFEQEQKTNYVIKRSEGMDGEMGNEKRDSAEDLKSNNQAFDVKLIKEEERFQKFSRAISPELKEFDEKINETVGSIVYYASDGYGLTYADTKKNIHKSMMNHQGTRHFPELLDSAMRKLDREYQDAFNSLQNIPISAIQQLVDKYE